MYFQVKEETVLVHLRYYSGDQERLFSEAHIISPNRTKSKVISSKRVSVCVQSPNLFPHIGHPAISSVMSLLGVKTVNGEAFSGSERERCLTLKALKLI